jgi:group I intron endonuclease
VGSAIDIERRWKQHHIDFSNNKNSLHLQNAWNKYGEDAFQWNILECVPNKEWLIEIEQYWIDFLDTASRDFGYNICPLAGSALGMKHTEEARRKMREAGIGKWLGKNHTEESKIKISNAKKGNKCSLGHKHTDETKIKMSEIKKGKPLSVAHRQKIVESRSKIKRNSAGRFISNKTPL